MNKLNESVFCIQIIYMHYKNKKISRYVYILVYCMIYYRVKELHEESLKLREELLSKKEKRNRQRYSFNIHNLAKIYLKWCELL